jgi:hypothetical protein
LARFPVDANSRNWDGYSWVAKSKKLPALPIKSAYMRHCLGSSSKRLPKRPPGKHTLLIVEDIR